MYWEHSVKVVWRKYAVGVNMEIGEVVLRISE